MADPVKAGDLFPQTAYEIGLKRAAHHVLVAYSEWLDSQNLLLATDDRSHEELVDEFLGGNP